MTVDVKRVYEEIASDEGKILHVYLCSENHKTTGIGHKLLPSDPEIDLPVHGAYDEVSKEDCISEGRCYELFQQDVHIAIDGCRKIYDNWEELPQEAQHILVNMCFQLGQGGLSRFKNMNHAVSQESWGIMAMDMVDSRWAQQTPERAERLRDRVLTL
jgi:lysozyme